MFRENFEWLDSIFYLQWLSKYLKQKKNQDGAI